MFGVERRNLFKTIFLGLSALSTTAYGQHIHTQNKISAKPFIFRNEPNRIRKSFYHLSDDELRNLCRAIGYMRNEYPLEHPLQWDNYARVHALHCTEADVNHPQVHWSWHFLPWHRGYLFFLERILANILTTKFNIDGSKFALPYWDWSIHKEIPNTRVRKELGLASPFFGYDLLQENMVNPDNLGFDNSALVDGNRGPTILKSQMNPDNELTEDSRNHVIETLHYMSPEYVSYMLAAPFDQFGGKPVTDRQTGQGLIEQGPHNDGHDWVGSRIGKNRTMGTLRNAAADPLFYMHHCNIDRIWSLYKNEQPNPAGPWGKQKYNFFDVDGSIVSWSIQDIIEKTINISYSHEVLNSAKTQKTSSFVSILVSKTIEKDSIQIPVPENMMNNDSVLLDIDTSVINHTGKYTIKIYADDKFIGKIKWMDGENRKHHKESMTHTFSLLLIGHAKNARSLTFVPPKRGNIKLTIKSINYKVM